MKTSAMMLCLFVLGTTACAGPVETRLRSNGQGLGEVRQLMWSMPPGAAAASPALVEAQTQVAEALKQEGFSFHADAPLSVSLGLAERPGAIAVSLEDGAALSPAKQHRLLQSCDDRILRLRVSIVDRATGEVRYDGQAQEAHCKASLADAVPRLARLAVADLARPGGDRRVLSSGRD